MAEAFHSYNQIKNINTIETTNHTICVSNLKATVPFSRSVCLSNAVDVKEAATFPVE